MPSSWDIFGLVVNIVGFGLAIWQIARTARAAEAARSAVERTEKRMALNHLLVLLPQFRMIEQDLDQAVVDNDRRVAIRILGSFSQFASQAAGLLDSREGVDQELVDSLRDLSRDAVVAKARLLNDEKRNVMNATKSFRDGIGDVSFRIGNLTTRFSLESGSHS